MDLPQEWTQIAWLDCDILFKNPNWAIDTFNLLQKHSVVQLFETCDRTDRNGKSVGDVCTSFGAISPNNP